MTRTLGEALRLAFQAMLAQFDLERLQEAFDRRGREGSILKLRYGDLYRDRYDALAQDGEAAFRQLFAAAFAKAYEEQLDHPKERGHGRIS